MSDAVKPKPTLVVRCPDHGHTLVEIVWEHGTIWADLRVVAMDLAAFGTEHPRPMPRYWTSRCDLKEEAEDRAINTVACKCGSRHLSMEALYETVMSGATGKLISDAPLVG